MVFNHVWFCIEYVKGGRSKCKVGKILVWKHHFNISLVWLKNTFGIPYSGYLVVGHKFRTMVVRLQALWTELQLLCKMAVTVLNLGINYAIYNHDRCKEKIMLWKYFRWNQCNAIFNSSFVNCIGWILNSTLRHTEEMMSYLSFAYMLRKLWVLI